MCGIFGYLGREHINLKAATDVISHRGPDSAGFLQYNIETSELFHGNPKPEDYYFGQRLLFGFRRLAIIDLDARSNQPFSSEDGKTHLVFNGEIYNYKELRSILESKSYIFKTDSDTEVLLNSYIEWGVNSFNKFNGMWSFAILDLKENRLLTCRDRFGIKPFYYHFNEELGSFYFGSEIKQLFAAGVKKEINENVILDFVDKAILESNKETFFKNIYSLEPGTYMNISLENISERKQERFWNLDDNNEIQNISYKTAVQEFKELFYDSIKLRFRSDVPVGSCLSGGLDSSSIVSAASNLFEFPIKTITSVYDLKEYDESDYSKLVGDKYANVESHYCQLNESIFIDDIDKILYYHDEPFPSMGILAQWVVMKKANSLGLKVLLDGQGGDESLAGYRKYYAFYLSELLHEFRILKFLKELFFLIKNKEFEFFNLKGIKRYIGKEEKNIYLSRKGLTLKSYANIGFKESKSMQERSKLDILKFSFPPLLKYEDRNSMAFSIETRVPFMDYRLVEYLYKTRSDFKIKDGYTKAILRDSMKGILPNKIRFRISKLGFASPQDVWMNSTLKEYFLSYFSIMNNPYFDNRSIVELFNNSKGTKSDFFFRVFCFDKWYQSHFGIQNYKSE